MALQPIEGQPGLFRDEAGQVVNIRDFRESDKWDDVVIPSGLAITPGSALEFFSNLQGKKNVDTNIKTQRKLSAGESMVLDRIGLYFRLAVGNTIVFPRDIKKVVENTYYRLTINDILQDEGPSIKFPSGYGMYGNTTENDAGVVSIGVPATASAARLVKKQLLNQNHEISGVMSFDSRTWLTGTAGGTGGSELGGITYVDPTLDNPVIITNYLHGLIRAAVTK
jgi:hypothetical protein